MTNTKKRLREEWLAYFYKESENCSQRPTHLTADTHGIVLDFLTSKINQALAEDRERMRGIIKNKKVMAKNTEELRHNDLLDDLLSSY